MAISQLPQAPYRQDRKVFPTPIIGDVLFSEVRDCNRGNPFPEYGTPYPNANKWPDHKLVYIKPVDIERNEIFEFFYAAERENQDLYNFALGNKIIANREFRMVTRTYVTLRENFKPEDIEFGTPMPDIPEGKFDGVSYVFFDKEQQNMQQEELNSLFVLEVHTYLEAAVLDEKLTLSVEKQDPLPPKFRVLAPTTTMDELAEGEVTEPTLTGDQLAVTEEQVNTDLKRKRTVSRSSANNTTSLSGKQVTNDLQVANVVETIVPDGTTIETSALTVDGSVESLGNGQSIQRVITAPELFTAKSFSAQRPDPVPEKFRILIPNQSTEENIAGAATMPTLTAGDLEATEQQVNVHVKRKRKTKRDTTLPKTLTQKATTNEKQVATVKETLQNGDTTVSPSATVDVQSEALGDGTYVVRETTVSEVFKAALYSVQKPDLTPEKFRATIPNITTEESIIGAAIPASLSTGDIQIDEQQQNKFVKRVRKTRRQGVTLPKTLTQKITTNDKQLATITETLQTGDTQEVASATKDIQSEALGDGTYVVRKVEVPKLFEAQTHSIEKPDTIPEKFRATIPIKTSQTNKQGQATPPALAIGELERSEQQLNEFVYREQITKRDIAGDVSLPQVQRAYVEGTIAKVNEKLSSSPTIESGHLISQSVATPIGDGKFVVETVKVDSWPQLTNTEWDNELNTQVVSREQFVSPPQTFNAVNTSYRAINKDRSLKVTVDEPVTALTNYVMSFPVQVDLQLPDVLKSISVVWAEDIAIGSYDSEWQGSSSGTSYGLTGSESASAESSASIKPELIIDIERPWGADTSATSYFFFVKGVNNVISESAFLTKLSSIVGGSVSRWPSFKPVSHTIVLTGGTAEVQARVNWTASKSYSPSTTTTEKTTGDGTSYRVGTSLNAVTIPPTIHSAITISGAQAKTKTVTATCLSGTGPVNNFPFVLTSATASHTLKADVNPKTLPATGPASIPTSGNYVVKSEVVPYKWGWARCSAVVVDAFVLA